MALFWIIAFFVAIGIISWIYEQVQEYLERERSRQRDEIAVSVLSETGIDTEVKDTTNRLFNYVVAAIPRKIEEAEEYEIVAPIRQATIKDHLCPTCGMGFLVRRNGQYGAFLGCNRYPNCKTTKPIGWVNKAAKAEAKKSKDAQKNQYSKKFMEDLKKAYN